MNITCFLFGCDLKIKMRSKKIVNDHGMQIGLISWLLCERCKKGQNVVNWSPNVGETPLEPDWDRYTECPKGGDHSRYRRGDKCIDCLHILE